MDMATKVGSSRFYSPPIKRRKIYDPAEVEIGYEFILRLITLRELSQEGRPATKEARQERFKRDKNVIAQQMGYDSYVAMPHDAKSFESRCSAIQNQLPKMRFSDIARFEKAFNQSKVDELYHSVMEELCYHAQEVKFSLEEKRHLLMRRMCCLTVPFVFKPCP